MRAVKDGAARRVRHGCRDQLGAGHLRLAKYGLAVSRRLELQDPASVAKPFSHASRPLPAIGSHIEERRIRTMNMRRGGAYFSVHIPARPGSLSLDNSRVNLEHRQHPARRSPHQRAREKRGRPLPELIEQAGFVGFRHRVHLRATAVVKSGVARRAGERTAAM